VFDMYKVHQDARYIPFKLTTPDYEYDGKKIPAVNVSASQDKAGKVHITMVNLDANSSVTLTTEFKDIVWKAVSGQVLTSGKVDDINTFAKPLTLVPKTFNGAKRNGDKLVVTIPSKSIVALELN
jgi:alpha-N-arabinofuranosidase